MSSSETKKFFYKVKQHKKNLTTGDHKRNQTQVAGKGQAIPMTIVPRQPAGKMRNFLSIYSVTLSIIES